jgi:hypothetical protein
MPLSKFSLLLAGLFAAATAQAQVDKLLGGATTTLSSRYAIVTGNPANISIVGDPAGSAKQVLRVDAKTTDTLVSGLSTNYVAPLGENTATGLRWYGLSVYLPAGWVTTDPNPVNLLTISTSTASGLPPPFAVVARGDNLELSLTSNYLATGSATAANSSNEVTRLGKITTGKWYCFVLRAEWYQALGSGKLTLWMNADKIYDSAQALNNYGTAFGNAPRVGLMYPGPTGGINRTAYVDFVRLGGPTSYAEQMFAETPCAVEAAATFTAAKAAVK